MNNERIMQEVENSIIRILQSGDLFTIPYSDKINISKEMNDIYSKLDKDRIVELVKKQIEENIATKIVNAFATEMGNDLKSLYSNKTIREDLKYSMRKNIELVIEKLK